MLKKFLKNYNKFKRFQSSQNSFKLGVFSKHWIEDKILHKSNIESDVSLAKEGGAKLVLLQELTLNQYFCSEKDEKWFELSEDINDGPSNEFFKYLSKKYEVHVIGSLFEKYGDNYYNTAGIWDDKGKMVGFTRKQHIPSGDGYEETFYFSPGNSDYPVHDLGFVKLAIPTCYDQWFPELARIYALKGAQLICYPTAIGSEPNHPKLITQGQWEIMMRSHAISNGIYVAASNRIGKEKIIEFYGGSFICDPNGERIDKNLGEIFLGEINLDKINNSYIKDRQPSTYHLIDAKFDPINFY
jgi:N-carbamoylputrescine amidase